MVAYSFRPRFVDLIVSGRKRQTIRADRKRHARAGEEVQLYTGMRTKVCRLIGRATCLMVSPITLDLEGNRIDLDTLNVDDAVSLDRFARADGFANWDELKAFWAAEHACKTRWSGVIVRWHEFAGAA